MPYKIDNKKVDKVLLHYVPHGINGDVFKPLMESEYKDFKNQVFENKKYDFVLFYNNRNIRRKQTSNIILAFRMFCDSLPESESKKCALLMHTQPIDNNGTDLRSVGEALCPDYDIVFTNQKLPPEKMNLLYNISDVTINVASNEGFGLSGAESLMTGTPIINNVTGGLQDHIGFRDENGDLIEFNKNWGSNHDGRYKKHGVWAKPVFPVNRMVQGSPPTPYIFDDHCKWEDIAHAIMYWYKMGNEKRKEFGLAGRDFALGEGGFSSSNLRDQFIYAMDKVFEYFDPKEKVGLYTDDEYVGHDLKEGAGFEIPKVDMKLVEKEIKEIKNG